MEVYLLRHGEAGTRMPIPGKDAERALTVAGREEVEDIGEGMAELNLKFDVIATSPLKRAKETAEVAAKVLKQKSIVEEWAELKPEADRITFYRRLGRLKPGSTVLCVGHEPYLSTAIGEITGRGGDGAQGFRIVMKKAGIARITVTGFNPRITGELRWLLTPRLLRKLA
jgi:phosphohistidine phosphatase